MADAQRAQQPIQQDNAPLEKRKQEEIEWANYRYALKDKDNAEYKKYKANEKYYSISRSSHAYIKEQLAALTPGKDVVELACGKQALVFWCADKIKSGLGLDISDVAVAEAQEAARSVAGAEKIKFEVRDCEKTGLPDNSFDVMMESGALHHMTLDVLYKEAARIIKPGGSFLCVEAIRHNPIIHTYRKLTPHLRTPWEVPHILARKDVMMGLKYFNKVSVKNFHLMTILAVPFRNTKMFEPILSVMEKIDAVLLKIPGFKWMGWQCVFVLSDPKK